MISLEEIVSKLKSYPTYPARIAEKTKKEIEEGRNKSKDEQHSPLGHYFAGFINSTAGGILELATFGIIVHGYLQKPVGTVPHFEIVCLLPFVRVLQYFYYTAKIKYKDKRV